MIDPTTIVVEYEPHLKEYIATCGDYSGHGSTSEEAIANLITGMEESCE